MRDFTLETFTLLLQSLKAQNYTFQTFRDFLKTPAPKAIVLRHDVDARKLNSLQTAKLEASLGIVGTYNFRIVPQSFDPDVIRQIAALGHEIGYHYEDLALAKGNMEVAIQLFEQHLAKLRQVASVDTICMHGSPLSRYDNRKIWENNNYRNYDIIGEPYFDVDFSKVLYLTDTGRRWDGEKVSIRDKVGTPSYAEASAGKSDKGQACLPEWQCRQGTSRVGNEEGVVKRNIVPLWLALPKLCRSAGSLSEGERGEGEDLKKLSFHSTFNIITAAKSGSLPAQIMITLHPQRWNNRMLPWMKELIWQRVKNGVKKLIVR